jgi:DNA-binding CsgD family transcriptional regulator
VLDDREALAELRAGDVFVIRELADVDVPSGGDGRWPGSAFAVVEDDEGVVSVLQVELNDTGGDADLELRAEAVGLFAAEWGHMLRSARATKQLRLCLEHAIEMIGDQSDPATASTLALTAPITDSGDGAVPQGDVVTGLDALDALTPRERDVFELLLEGASNATISESLFITLSTVKSHVKSILSKLGLATRLQVLARYRNVEFGHLHDHG